MITKIQHSTAIRAELEPIEQQPENFEKQVAVSETLRQILEKVIVTDITQGSGQEITFSFVVFEATENILHPLCLLSSILLLNSAIQTFDVMASSVIVKNEG